jgi:hypothetical protein
MLSQERTQTVEEQLSNYNYTFPKVLKVGDLDCDVNSD